jgi:hypothetical protein
MFLCAAAIGCGGDEPGAVVRGKVIYKNAPFNEGSIVFFPEGSGQAAYGNLQQDGTFALKTSNQAEQIAPGKYVAVVVAGADRRAQLSEDPLHRVDPVVPLKFSRAGTSPLKYEVKLGLNEFDINLDKK